MLNALLLEIEQRANYLDSKNIETIYFGGGTPTAVETDFISKIIEKIHQKFDVTIDAEITIEANPDDMDEAKILEYKQMGINRLSIGIQSFDDQILKYLNRVHNAQKAIDSIRKAQKIGFENISIDLMYGIPGTDLENWKRQLHKLEILDIQHLSSYCLTIEPRTLFGNYLKNNKLNPLPDDVSLDQLKALIDHTEKLGFEHYEISNFAKKDKIARHNSAYWLGKKYLGIGPGAHSYNKNSRQYNISNNNNYIYKVSNGEECFDLEILSKENIFDEYIITALRTKWGLDVEKLKEDFNYEFLRSKVYDRLLIDGYIINENNIKIRLSKTGITIADNIILDILSDNDI
jgi:oxygen-independent coproporphyrinogen III oxidase